MAAGLGMDYLLRWPVFWDLEPAYCSLGNEWYFSTANTENSISTPTWCIPRHLRPFCKCWMAEFGIDEVEKISCRTSSSKKRGIFPFWRILSPVIKKGRFIKSTHGTKTWKHENSDYLRKGFFSSILVFIFPFFCVIPVIFSHKS